MKVHWACLGLALIVAPSVGLANPLQGLALGMPEADVRAALGPSARSWRSEQPQALRQGLVRSRLLEALHRAQAAPKTPDGALDAQALASFLVARRGAIDYTAVFAPDGGLNYALVRIPVPLASKDPFVKARLRPFHSALADLRGFALRAKDKDSYGNPRTWTGRGSGGTLWVRHVPEDDELWVLLFARSRG